jgi:hypothetical protein
MFVGGSSTSLSVFVVRSAIAVELEDLVSLIFEDSAVEAVDLP